MRHTLIATITVLMMMLGIVPGHAEKRVALVIGNSAYRNEPSLRNPANDTAAMAELFRSARFDVVEPRSNVGNAELRRAIRDFADSARVQRWYRRGRACGDRSSDGIVDRFIYF